MEAALEVKLSILVDNNTLIDHYYSGEPGVSFYIETGDTRVLFDTGYSDVVLRNAQAMAIDLRQTDAVVLSHGHVDHTGGLEALVKLFAHEHYERGKRLRPRLVAHPAALAPRKLADGTSNGIAVSEALLEASFDVQTSPEPVWLDRRLVFLGQIERRTPFEHPAAIGFRWNGRDGWLPDDLPDDSALAYVAPEGIVVISGCSHAGICNIVQAAQRITGVSRVLDIVGGFHLQQPPAEQLQGTLAFVESLSLDALHACHCTDLGSKVALASVSPLQEVGCGLQLEY